MNKEENNNLRSGYMQGLDHCLLNALQNELQIANIFHYHTLIHKWKDVVGQSIASHAYIVEIKPPLLVLQCKDSAWMQQIQMQQRQILKKINDFYKENLIEKIKIQMHRQSYMKQKKTSTTIDYEDGHNKYIDFSKINIDKKDLERIEKNSQILTDPKLRELAKKVQIQQLKKNKVFEANGYHHCKICQNWIAKEEVYCSSCKGKIQRHLLQAIKRVIKAYPYIKYDEILRFGKCSLKEFNLARSEMIYSCLNQIFYGSTDLELMYRACQLMTHKKKEELTKEHVINICSKFRSKYLSDIQIEALKKAGMYKEPNESKAVKA